MIIITITCIITIFIIWLSSKCAPGLDDPGY